MILTVISFVLATACVVSGFVVLRGTSSWTRLLAYTLVAGKVNLLIMVFALATDQTFYLDVAVVYTLLSYVGVLVLSQYMARKEPGDA
jgi:multicomponent Na+:H+ antiporter subunit F